MGVLPPNISAERARHTIEVKLQNYQKNPQHEYLRNLNNTKSMLHEDVLMVLHFLASATRGGILELGAYMGGSTIALAKGINGRRPFISVEIGGAHDHPTLASNDIFADLQRNVTEAGVASRVHLINADSRDPETVAAVKTLVGRTRIGLFSIDTDGFIERDFESYSGLLAPGCVLVLDDYSSRDAATDLPTTYPGYFNTKNNIVKPVVDRMVADGELIPFGVYGWGTWVGRMAVSQFAPEARTNTN